MEKIEQYKYLEVTITCNGREDTDTRNKIIKGKPKSREVWIPSKHFC